MCGLREGKLETCQWDYVCCCRVNTPEEPGSKISALKYESNAWNYYVLAFHIFAVCTIYHKCEFKWFLDFCVLTTSK